LTVTESKFEATWIPRIGERATAELRRYRRAGLTVPLSACALGAAGIYAFHGGLLDKLLGGVLMAGAVGVFVMLIRYQLKVKAAISDWFGVKIRGLPLMNTKDFDAYCQKQGLRRPDLSARVEPSREGGGPPVSDVVP
jgi:hypothetical protein